MSHFLLVLVSLSACISCYASRLAIKVNGGENEARAIALKYGYSFEGQIGEIENVYQLSSRNGKRKSLSLATTMKKMKKEKKVEFIKRQYSNIREKRDFQEPTDPLWDKQWALHSTSTHQSEHNMRVMEAWIQGFTGEGVTVGIVDDGLQYTHPDLSANHDDNSSYDFVNYDNDPSPNTNDSHGTECAGVVSMSKSNGLCGVGVAYNAKIAGLRIFSSGYKRATDIDEANALNYRFHNIDIYSNSWGPRDNGFTIDGPKYLTKLALQIGAIKGRRNKGNIFVWAAGNGGSKHDTCATDGYINSIYTIAVGSVDSQGRQSFYDEQCSAKMAVAFSFNSGSEGVAHNPTTTLESECTESFTGTSAATPLLSGVIALALQANPSLTWRDVQYLIVYTSNSELLMKGDNARLWMMNGAGIRVSSQFGFGAIDAEAMVTRAREWSNVPPQQLTLIVPPITSRSISSESTLNIRFTVNRDTQDDVINPTSISFLEHIIVEASLQLASPQRHEDSYSYNDYYNQLYNDPENIDNVLYHNSTRRGDIKIHLQSPSGTLSTLLPYRDRDFINSIGYNKWPFMSVQYWGEDPVGEWKLSVTYRGVVGSVSVSNIKIKLFGTHNTAESVRRIPNPCPKSCRNNRCSSHFQCDTCKQLRNSQTLECLSACPNDTKRLGKYCIGLNQTNATVSPSPPCQSTDDTHLSVPGCFSSIIATTSSTGASSLPSRTPQMTTILDKPKYLSGSPLMHSSTLLLIVLLVCMSILI